MRLTRLAVAAALAPALGCSVALGPAGPDVAVSLYLLPGVAAAPAARPALFRADIGGRRVDVPAPDAGPRSDVDVRGPRYGDVPVRVTLLAASGDTLATAAYTQRFERDHDHWVAAMVGAERPVGHCIGTLSVVPLRTAGRDTLFLMHGRIPKGAIC
jgi:hypothetical protein